MLEDFTMLNSKNTRVDLKAANAVLKTGHHKIDTRVNAANAAAMMLTIQTIYNLDETISRS